MRRAQRRLKRGVLLLETTRHVGPGEAAELHLGAASRVRAASHVRAVSHVRAGCAIRLPSPSSRL